MTDKQYGRTKTTSVDYTMHSSYLLRELRPGIKLSRPFLNHPLERREYVRYLEICTEKILII